MLIKIINGAVRFGANTILENIDFEIKDGQKIAVIGRNGSGKTTLIKSILGDIELEEGISDKKFQVIVEGNPSIGYVKQENIVNVNNTLLDEILECYKDIVDISKRIEIIEKKLEFNYSDDILNEYHRLREQYRYMGGYTYIKEYETAILKFGFTEEDKYKKINEFSLGQRTKITLLKLLLSKPDVLFLDEPTNHLDIVTVEWLEGYLREYSKSLVVISHDRMFLDRIVSIVYEIEYGCLTRYKGNYSDYVKQKKEIYEKQLKDYKYQQKEIKRLNAICERFKYKPNKASMALSKLKQIEHMVKIECPNKYDTRTFKANFVPKIDSYKDVLKIKNLAIGYNSVLKVINLSVEKGNKIGIIGKNGSGKSTFLKTLLGKIKPISGKIIFGERVEVGYFDQELSFVDNSHTVYEEIECDYSLMSNQEIRNSLGAFEFSGEDVFKFVSDLSGGEKVRLMLCKIMLKKPNLLILDEPTNHLDMIGKDSLERILNSYNGTVIFVSHDRYFVSRVATSLLVFNDLVEYYPYGYLEYEEKNNILNKLDDDVILKNDKKNKSINKDSSGDKRTLQKKISAIEKEIVRLEEKVSLCESEMLKEDVYMDRLKSLELLKKIDEYKLKISTLESEWDSISELII